MKLLTGWAVSAGLILAAGAVHAQILAPGGVGRAAYAPVSDLEGPSYSEVPPPVEAPPAPRYGSGYGYDYRYGPPVMPPQEVYAVLRDNGFSPLGAPHQRGYVYTISAIDSEGEDGRLVIDGRNGRILRFTPAYGMGPNFEEDSMRVYGPRSELPPPTVIRGVPRPPMPIPHVASRHVPVPRPAPLAVRPMPESPQQTAAVQARPAGAPASAAPAGTVGEARQAQPQQPQIRPTQPMPAVQGLD